jgi:hypothetical protein
MLVIEGPLRDVPAPQMDAFGKRLVDMVEKGL